MLLSVRAPCLMAVDAMSSDCGSARLSLRFVHTRTRAASHANAPGALLCVLKAMRANARREPTTAAEEWPPRFAP